MESKNFDQITIALAKINFLEHFDLIVAIADGGLIPAAMINQKLRIPLRILKISYRNEDKQPMYNEPQVVEQPSLQNIEGKNILLIDDVSRSGATFLTAREVLKSAKTIKTFVVNGQADYALFNEQCFKFPWLIN